MAILRSGRSFLRLIRGITLIELLVILVILAILAAILFPVFAAARDKARQSAPSFNFSKRNLSPL